MPWRVSSPLFSFPLALAVTAALFAVSGGIGLVQAQDGLDLPERIGPRTEGSSLRRKELRPNAVVRPPGSGAAAAPGPGAAGFGTGRLSWRLFKPNQEGVAEVAGEGSPTVLRTTPVERIRGIVLLPGETALELTDVDRELVAGGRDAGGGAGDAASRAARALALRRQIEDYTSGVRVAPAFEGIRDHGTRPSSETITLLQSLLGKSVEGEAERGIAEALILGFAASGRMVDDVIVVKDDTAPGVFKVVVLWAKGSGEVSAGQ